jgi:hypothetical protein
MDDVQARQLLKQVGIGAATCTNLSPGLGVDVVATGQNWTSILPEDVTIGQVILANRSFIDLAGYSKAELTTFIQSVAVQEMRDPLSIGAASPQLVYSYDFLTTRKIRDSELAGLISTAPGYHGNTLDLMEMIYGQHRTYALNANIAGTYITTNSDVLGSGNPTAGDRVHWTRVYYFSPTGAQDELVVFQMYAANLVCQAVTGKEKDLIWIERLRRAYTQDPGRNE